MKLAKFLMASSFILIGSLAFADGQYYESRQQGYSQQNPMHRMHDDTMGMYQGGYYSNDPRYQQYPQQYSNDPGYHIDQYGNKIYHDQRSQQSQHQQGHNTHYQR